MQNVIGTRIKHLRTQAGMTQRELAEKMNIGKSTLSQYELGDRSPGIDMQQKFAKIFGVSLDFLVGLTDDRAPKPERASPEPAPPDPAFLEAMECLEGLSGDALLSALRCLQAIRALDMAKGNVPADAAIFEKNA